MSAERVINHQQIVEDETIELIEEPGNEELKETEIWLVESAEKTEDEIPIDVDDTLSLYLAKIREYPLLTGEEEETLARALRKGKEAQERLQKKSLTPEETAFLEHQVRLGAEARNRMVEGNLRLVVSVAKRYRDRGLPFLDLIQEGNIGLMMKAVEKFNPDLGYKFSTYAVWWIRQAIGRAIADQARTIRLPVYFGDRSNRLARVTRKLMQELGRKPSVEEIADAMDLKGDQVEEVIRASRKPLSLEQPVGEDEDSFLGDFIEDTNQHPEEGADSASLKEGLRCMLDTLSDKERKVLTLRFGLDGKGERTLEEVGQKFGVSRERIRQIEAKALRKLRHPYRSKNLRELFIKST